ncbi:MAG: T9SS type A sorting domain-containing protein [Chlorobi bacterium]|nr:T9SS type A sorting domain-containing protein [Chlorobiota bacterium]
MFKKFNILLFATVLCVTVTAQETQYFNNIYKHGDNFASGMAILETDDGYIGYGGTEDPGNIGLMLLLFKIDKQGEELTWKPFGEDYHDYFMGNVGGSILKAPGNGFVICFTGERSGSTYASLVKFSENLDTIWKKEYSPEYRTIGVNFSRTSDNGYCLTGWVWKSESEYSDLLLIKTDSMGVFEWHKTYGGYWAEQGTNVIQTPDGGYLIGGYFWKPGTDHSLDAMVVKTDSLGNEQWTKYFGNPDIDDDMAFVQMAGDGNYLVATVYGEEIITSDERRGRVAIMKIDTLGNMISIHKFGPNKIANHIKNFKNNNGHYITSGYYYVNEGLLFKGWGLKLSLDIDSIWMFDYTFFNEQDDRNYLYDITPTSDNGYIAIGSANVGFTQSNMWVLKVDSMGCDTPGCATGTWVRQIYARIRGEALSIFPNPVTDHFKVSGFKAKGHGNGTIRIYGLQGIKVEEIKIPKNAESTEVDVSAYPKGIYYLQYVCSGRAMGSGKFIKE